MSRSKLLFFGLVAGMVCLTLIISTLILSNGNFYIKNLGTSLEQDGKIINSITVNGDGRVFIKPDTVSFSVGISETASTSEEALNKANEKVNAITTALVSLGVNQDHIQTSAVTIYTEYDYTGNNRRLVGQTAGISLNVKVNNIGANSEKASRAIDLVSKISNVQLSGITFDLEDKTSALRQAREMAFNKAKDKATDLAGYGGVKLLTPVSISETSIDYSPEPVYAGAADVVKTDSAGSTQIQTGELELTISVSVVFGIE